jgi:hypothetical protein
MWLIDCLVFKPILAVFQLYHGVSWCDLYTDMYILYRQLNYNGYTWHNIGDKHH